MGRTEELGAIAAAAVAARAGRPLVVSVEGAAGAGKSALVRRAVAGLGEDTTIVSVEADELAGDVRLDLVRSLVDVPADEAPFAAGLAVLGAWSDLADGPLLVVVVEDLHWADLASRQALAVATRRLQHERLVLVATSRPEHDGVDDGWNRLRADADRCWRVRLGALGVGDVGQLAAARGITLGSAATSRLHAHTGGNPLYVSTLLTEIPPEVLSTSAALPAPRTLAATTVARLAELPTGSVDLAAALAVLNRPVPIALLAVVADVDAPTPPLDSLLASGFVEMRQRDGTAEVAFVHPLFRAAVYEDLMPQRRRALHAAAASVTDRVAALGHRVAAADQPDDVLAAELETAARRPDEPSASRLWSWAADLTVDRGERDRRRLSAFRQPLRADDVSAAAALRRQLERCEPSALRDLVVGQLAWLDGDRTAAQQLVGRAAVDGADDIAGEAYVRLAGYASARGRPAEALDAADHALAIALDDPMLVRQARAYRAVALGQRDGAVAGLQSLRELLPASADAVEPEDAGVLAVRGMLEYFAGHAHAAARDLDAVTRRLRASTTRLLRRSHVHLAQSLTMIGAWDDALLNARVALDLADEDHRLEVAQAHAAAAGILAARGQWDDATHHVERSAEAAATTRIGEAVFASRVAAAALHRARGEHAQVVAALEPLSRSWSKLAMFSSEWWFAFVVALQNSGNLDGAQHQIDLLERFGAQRSIDVRMRVAGLRGSQAARRGETDLAGELFEVALAAMTPDDPALDASSIHHAYGRLLRGQGRRHQAIEQLRLAHARFDGLEASPYLDRVNEQLALIGLQPSGPGKQRSRLDLTEREHDVVTLALKGMTNREIAADLYVSPKAIEYHLRNVFGKLGISSRRQLREVPALRIG